MALAEILVKIYSLHFYTYILNEFAKEEKKKTDWITFHRVLLRKKGEYLSSISLTNLMIVSSFSNARCFQLKKASWRAQVLVFNIIHSIIFIVTKHQSYLMNKSVTLLLLLNVEHFFNF